MDVAVQKVRQRLTGMLFFEGAKNSIAILRGRSRLSFQTPEREAPALPVACAVRLARARRWKAKARKVFLGGLPGEVSVVSIWLWSQKDVPAFLG